MAFNQTWNESEPTDTTEAKDIDNEIRKVKEALRERLAVDHEFFEDESGHDNVGEHKKGSARIDFGEATNKPDNDSDNPGLVYVETDTEKVLYDNGSEWVNLLAYLDSDGDGTVDNALKIGGKTIYVQSEEPSSPNEDDIWIEV